MCSLICAGRTSTYCWHIYFFVDEFLYNSCQNLFSDLFFHLLSLRAPPALLPLRVAPFMPPIHYELSFLQFSISACCQLQITHFFRPCNRYNCQCNRRKSVYSLVTCRKYRVVWFIVWLLTVDWVSENTIQLSTCLFLGSFLVDIHTNTHQFKNLFTYRANVQSQSVLERHCFIRLVAFPWLL